MTIQLLIGDDIRSQVLRILSGSCHFQRMTKYNLFPSLYILSPWISDVIIEFSDLFLSKEVENEEVDTMFYFDYNIKSINLAHALLLLKLHNGVNVNLVTLPFNKMDVSPNYLRRTKKLLDFLDEIGCNIFFNTNLHSKLLLANDLALLGSFNLTSSALYYREEIGVSIDDIGNLNTLEKYCTQVVHTSEPYGYSSSLSHWGTILDDLKKLSSEALKERRLRRRDLITRGWLLDKMLNEVYQNLDPSDRYFCFFHVTSEDDKRIRSYAQNLSLFYLMSLRRLVSCTHEESKYYSDTKKEAERIRSHSWVKSYFGYKGDESTNSIMEFLNNKFARKSVPDIKLRIKSLES